AGRLGTRREPRRYERPGHVNWERYRRLSGVDAAGKTKDSDLRLFAAWRLQTLGTDRIALCLRDTDATYRMSERICRRQPGLDEKRLKGTYAFRSLLDSGAVLALGSDSPVATMDPLFGIYAAVTRRTLDDKNPNGWIPEQKITVDEAVRGFTWGGAYSEFQENLKGTLEIGKLADFVVVSDDIFKIDPVKIRDAKVLTTVVDGKVVFEAR